MSAATTTPGSTSIPEEARSLCLAELRGLRSAVPGVSSVGLAGPDGFEVASVLRSGLDVAKISALTSTMIGVAHAVAREADLSPCRELILETDSGRVLFLDVRTPAMRYALFVISADDSLLGRIISQARLRVSAVERILTEAAQ